jgi:two-component system sensor histidine kinase CpxA
MMRSLYARLFITFVAVLAVSVGAFYQAYMQVTRPTIGRMIAGSQAAQADEATAALRRGGEPDLREYLQRLDSVTQMPHYLVDQSGRDVVSSVDRSELLVSGEQRGSRGARTIGDQVMLVTPSSDGLYRLITLAPVPYTLWDFAPYIGFILAGVAVFFWLVVASIVSPVRRLADAVHRFGRGEFAARAPVSRKDEIGQLAGAFNEMAARIETLVTAERRLLQDVSHELRSPLTRLNLEIELSRTAADRNVAADRLQREASRLSDLVATLLEVVRLEGDPGSTPTAAVPLMDLLRDSIESCSTEADRRNVRIELAGDPPGTLDANPELLRRAFDNVITNATRYAPAGSTVTLTCATAPGEQVIEVRDTGPGVEEEQLEKLGSPFYRADESRSADTGGVGLGLAIARRAIHLHRGTVEFANASPGLRVTLRLPAMVLLVLCLAAPSMSAQASTPGAPAWAGKWRLDVAESVAGPAPYVRGTRQLQMRPDGILIVEDFVRPRGGTVHLEWSGALDGQDRRVHGVDLYVTYAYRQLDERTLEGIVKVDGVLASRSRERVSPDGRSMTVETTPENAPQRSPSSAAYVRVR